MLFSYNHCNNYTQRDCVHKISALLLLLLLISVTGCEDKKPDEASIPIENTTEFVSQPKNTSDCANKFKIEHNRSVSHTSSAPVKTPKLIESTNTFMLLNTKSKSHKVTISNKSVRFHNNKKSIVLVNLFATWCPPCIGQLSSLNRVQKKYSKNLLLIGVLTHDTTDTPTLKSFIAKHEINYFISSSPHNTAFSQTVANTLLLPENFSIPLTILYVEGEYFTHYEGTVPVEMIEYDIDQALKQLKSKEA